MQREADRLALAKYAPPAVLVNRQFEILQFRGETGAYLAPAPGAPSSNVLKMAREGLLVGLRSALHKASQEGVAVQHEGLRVKSNGGTREVNLTVLPVRDGSGNSSFLVVFEEPGWAERGRSAIVPEPATPGLTPQGDGERQVAHLASELAATREYMQSLVEQQEAANEELQSANEEIQSSNEELQSVNEELQTTKEEIQSSNEELTTVNEELRERNLQLDRANNDLMNFLASTHLAMVMVGPDLRIRHFTPQAEKWLNLISTDVGRPISDINLPLRVADLHKSLAQVVETVSAHDEDVQDKNGCWYSLRLRPYRTTEGKIDGAVLVLVDMNAQKRAEESLREAAARKDEFLAMLAHELRNPLASLRNYLDLLHAKPADREPAQWCDALDRQVQKLTQLVDDLLDASRISQGIIELKTSPMNLVPAIDAAVEAARQFIDAREHVLSVSLPGDPILVQGDPIRLEQVVLNLLHNAAKYTEAHGRLELSLTTEGNEAVLQIKDNGIGIAPELLPRIFDLFVQGDVSYSRERGGLGIGLSLVYKLVRLHQGTVSAQSDGPGKGAVFNVRLPLLQQSDVRPKPPTNESSDDGHAKKAVPRRILIVDDNLDSAETLGMLLRLSEHKVLVTGNGPAAIDVAPEFKPDVVLLDIGMPGMNGYEVARELRTHLQGRKYLLAAISGYGQDETRRRSQEEGFDAHLVKPVALKDLLAILDRAPVAAPGD